MGLGRRPPGASARGTIVLLGNKLSVPAYQGVGRDKCGQIAQDRSSQDLGADRESTALGVCELQTSFSHLLSENAVFLEQVVDDMLMIAPDEACHRDDE